MATRIDRDGSRAKRYAVDAWRVGSRKAQIRITRSYTGRARPDSDRRVGQLSTCRCRNSDIARISRTRIGKTRGHARWQRIWNRQ